MVICSMSCTLALVQLVRRCVCAEKGGVILREAFNISDSLQNRYPHPPRPSLCQTREKPAVISSPSTNGLHCSVYLAPSLLLMNEGFSDSQSQYASGMPPYHQVMNECED